MNDKLKASLDLALESIENMSSDEFFKTFFGYTKEEESAYTEENFLQELEYLKTFFVDGYYSFEPSYDNLPVPKMSKLFWNYIDNNSRSYEDHNAVFPTCYVELPKYGILVTHISGQGTITVVENFDYNNVEYIAKNSTRIKREHYENEIREQQELLIDLPNEMDLVSYTTTHNGTEVSGTGVVRKVYIKDKKNKVVNYLIDSDSIEGGIIVTINNEKYPNDNIVVIEKYHTGDGY